MHQSRRKADRPWPETTREPRRSRRRPSRRSSPKTIRRSFADLLTSRAGAFLLVVSICDYLERALPPRSRHACLFTTEGLCEAMPELPEVETVRRGLEPAMVGARLVRVTQRRPDLRFPFPKNF